MRIKEYWSVLHDERRMEFRQYWRMNLAEIRLLCVFTGMMTALCVWFMLEGTYNMILDPIFGVLGLLALFAMASYTMPGQLTSRVIIDEAGVCLKTKRIGEKLIRWGDVTRIERHRVNLYDYTWLLIGNSMNESIRFYYSAEIEDFIFEMHPECKYMLQVMNDCAGPPRGT